MLNRPITFTCRHTIAVAPTQITSAIADVTQWRDFKGYGFLPGIAHAEYEVRTGNMIGSRIRVHNTDGSSHCEEIDEWVEGKRVAMKFCDFSPPVKSLATHFVEEWDLAARENVTVITRTFSLFPKNALTHPVLWFISFFLKRAIDCQLVEMAQAATKR
ncbi:MAG: SRPBCC family protein [Caldilinea sp. CFX5]|nr:SRPBCC family protein [Caldilinea sp. CFX5]